MFVAGIDAHTRYVVVVVVNKAGERVLGPTRVTADAPERLVTALAPYRPLEAVVETSSSWPWLDEVLTAAGVRFVLAHAKRLRAIAEANYKRDAVDAELLARMRLAGLIPEVYPTPYAQREWATLIRHRGALVAQRTGLVNRIHAQLHARGLYVERGWLLTRAGRQWLRTGAGPRLAAEQRALVRSHLRLVARLTPLVRALDRRIAQVAAAIPEAHLLQTIPGIGPHRGPRHLRRGAAGQPLPDAGPSGGLRGARPALEAERPAPRAALGDPAGRQPVAARGARAGGRRPRAGGAEQLAQPLLRGAEGPARVAGRARGGGAEAGARGARHAPDAARVDGRTQ